MAARVISSPKRHSNRASNINLGPAGNPCRPSLFMPKEINIFVGPSIDGQIEINYVHTDDIDTSMCGAKVAPRVSDVEFDTETQEWVARLLNGQEIARHVNREQVIADERKIIDGMIERQEAIPGFNVEVSDAA